MTNCPNSIVDTDNEPIAPCGDEGRMCDPCAEADKKNHEWMQSPAQDMAESRRLMGETI